MLEGSSLGRQIGAFLALEFILVVQLVDLLCVLSVAVPQVLELFLQVLLLLQQLVV